LSIFLASWGFGNPDFVQLAESFGVKGVRPTLLNEFEQALKDALHQTNELTLIDVIQK
jgi:acetolactate synthase-1/2/3 large subunit